eukprot:scaffold1909_cov130-Cylindrotheca_fusiformis.AAC.9
MAATWFGYALISTSTSNTGVYSMQTRRGSVAFVPAKRRSRIGLSLCARCVMSSDRSVLVSLFMPQAEPKSDSQQPITAGVDTVPAIRDSD